MGHPFIRGQDKDVDPWSGQICNLLFTLLWLEGP
jgi:hypothetical protein